MKKLKMLSTTAFRPMALMLCLAMAVPQLQAAIYIVGDGFDGGWVTNQGSELTLDSSTGLYTLEHSISNSGYFCFATGRTSGSDDWDSFKTNYRRGPQSDGTGVGVGATTTTVENVGNSYMFTGSTGTYEFVYNSSSNQFRIDHRYYVLGSNNSLWANGWSTSPDASQKMTNNGNGTWTWKASGITLSAGSMTCKAYGNSTWFGNTDDNGDLTISVPENGEYNLTITFNGSRISYSLDKVSENTFDIYVRYMGSENLSNVFIYAWDSSQTLSDAWSGSTGGTPLSSMTAETINGYTYYHVTYTSHDSNIGIIFNENGSNSTQTNALTANTGENYFTYGGGSTVTGPNAQADVLPSYYIIGDEGLGLQWGDTPTTTQMSYDAETGLYYYTHNVTEVGTYYFVFADGESNDWTVFNSTYRIGPTGDAQHVTLDGSWVQTQKANGNDKSYSVYLDAGPVTIYYNANTSKFMVDGVRPIYIEGSSGIGLDWGYAPTQRMTYDASQQVYTYTYNVTREGEYHFIFADGQVLGVDNETDAWNTFNYWNRISPNGSSDTFYNVNSDWSSTQYARLGENVDSHSYYTRLGVGQATIYFDYANMKFKVEGAQPEGIDLYLVGGFVCDSVTHYYNANDGVRMSYDSSTKLYYLNNVTLNDNATFCFTEALAQSADDWSNVGNRYGNGTDSDINYIAPETEGGIGRLDVVSDYINTNLPLAAWQDNLGEWKMSTAGIFNVLVDLENNWVKLIRTDNFTLYPMNVYLEQTPNVTIDNIQEPGTDYNTTLFPGTTWPLSSYNRRTGTWNPSTSDNHYDVKYIGVETTDDGKTWWHWEVQASICEIFFTRTNTDQGSIYSDTIQRRSGVLWYTWEDDNTMTDHTREYFESSAEALPTNVEVQPGHYYVYFINTVGWENVYVTAWESDDDDYVDGYGNHLIWPGKAMTCVGIDPETGYEVWVYDFGLISPDVHTPTGGILFHDGTQDGTVTAKEQTGDFTFVNGGVYDYLGLFDGAYTLNNLIRKGHKKIRYTISNDLLGVYYDDDAATDVYDDDGNFIETIYGALYAKDFDLYQERSENPDKSVYTDYVYTICATTGDDTRPSQIMDKRESYDQSNWVKLVISPNYDGGIGNAVVGKNDRPYLKNFVNHVIPGGTLDVYMTDSINPQAQVMAITRGDSFEYEPNVYVSAHFNDSIVFNYTHQEWLPKMPDGSNPYKGTYRTKPVVTWNYDANHNVINGTVTRERVEEDPYMMYYVAPKPQEIAYITWIVYDNDNNDGVYYGYNHEYYMPETSVAVSLPNDPGRFYAPKNWDRSIMLDKQYYDSLMYLSENQLEDWLGGYGDKYGPYSNGYMQYGAVKVNWSLFGDSINHVIRENNEDLAWWQIFEPGQAYKIKALIRYSRSDSIGYENEECYAPGNGAEGFSEQVSVRNAPRREAAKSQRYANMYFTGDYSRQGLEASKFIIFPLEASPSGSNGSALGNVTSVKEVIDVSVPREVIAVRYYNLMGVASDSPFDGINIVVTTYSDGSSTSKKILR